MMLFIIEEAKKKSVLDFSQGTMKVMWMPSYNYATACSTIYFALIWYKYKMTQCNTWNLKFSNSQLKIQSFE